MFCFQVSISYYLKLLTFFIKNIFRFISFNILMPGVIWSKDKVRIKYFTRVPMPGYDSFLAHHHPRSWWVPISTLCSYHDENWDWMKLLNQERLNQSIKIKNKYVSLSRNKYIQCFQHILFTMSRSLNFPLHSDNWNFLAKITKADHQVSGTFYFIKYHVFWLSYESFSILSVFCQKSSIFS